MDRLINTSSVVVNQDLHNQLLGMTLYIGKC